MTFAFQAAAIVFILAPFVAAQTPNTQQPTKPQVYAEGIPPEPIAKGTCTYSTFGYLELNGKRTKFTEAEFGQMLLPSLVTGGYVLTIYPATEHGIFVSATCPSSKDAKEPQSRH
jgi:hypothetical protein